MIFVPEQRVKSNRAYNGCDQQSKADSLRAQEMHAAVSKFRIITGVMLAVTLSIIAPSIGYSEEILQRRPAAGADFNDDAKFAPDRKVDIELLSLDITPNLEKRTISGTMTLTFKPVAKPLEELRLDAVDLTVQDVTSDVKITHQSTDKQIIVNFVKPIPVGSTTHLTIQYSAEPQQGLYFRVPSNGYSKENMHMFSQGEMIEARHWFPCFDSPNAKFRSEVTCHVPDGFTVLSNGKMTSSTKDANGLVAVHWEQDKPHVNYLVSLVVGKFSAIEEKYHDIPLKFYSLKMDEKEAPGIFAPTKPAMEFIENQTGIKYPWAQYGQVAVQDFNQSGMENTTLTTLNDSLFFSPDTKDIFAYGGIYAPTEWFNAESIVTHELAHQWFGDLVTCKDWSHAWLNEGFATYYSLLYAGKSHGDDDMKYGLHQILETTMNMKDEHPLVYRKYFTPTEQFEIRAYAKAAWVLHMLRSELGTELFDRCIKTYLERYQYKSVVTEDLNRIVEELSGRSFDRFFDQWVYHAGIPQLDVQYSWDEAEKVAKVSVSQSLNSAKSSRGTYYNPDPASQAKAQASTEQATSFQFPLTLRFKTKTGITDRQVQIKQKDEDFYVSLKDAPEVVRIDPNQELLANIVFSAPKAMLYKQQVDESDMIGRILATEKLGESKSALDIGRLKSSLNKDPFFGVRVKASESLRQIHSDAALTALIESLKQSDDRVRYQVVHNIAQFFHPLARKALIEALDGEKNPAIIAQSLIGIGRYHDAETRALLLKFLEVDSYRNMIQEGAIAAMRKQDDTTFLAPIMKVLSLRNATETTQGYNTALDALAYLARNEKSKDEIREFLAARLNNKRQTEQLGAMKALGTLEDPKAIALLETFASASFTSPLHREATTAIARLRAVNKQQDNLYDLREELLELKTAQRKDKQDIDELKKKLTKPATQPATPTSHPTPAPTPTPPISPSPSPAATPTPTSTSIPSRTRRIRTSISK